jgi:hypothetical protein
MRIRPPHALAFAGAVAAAVALGVPTSRAQPDLSAYSGLGTWIDIYRPQAWQAPAATAAGIAARGAGTLFLQTGNYRQRTDLVRPEGLAELIEAAHAQGLQVVAWYLPSFASPSRDLRRSLAAIRFRTPRGEGFDSFALDIEASVVKPAARRSARVLSLAAVLRAAVGPGYPLGAIIPSPRGMDLKPKYWPGFPYTGLARSFDVFMPMGYFTYRYKTASASGAYTAANVELLRARTGDDGLAVHAVGGLAGAATVAQVRAFATAAAQEGALGASLYDYATTKPAQWRALSAAAG